MSNYIQIKQRLQYPSFIFQLNMCLSKKAQGPHHTSRQEYPGYPCTSPASAIPRYGTQQWKDSPEKNRLFGTGGWDTGCGTR